MTIRKCSTTSRASSSDLPTSASLIIDIEACEIEQPSPVWAISVTVPSSMFSSRWISSPQSGLFWSTATVGLSSDPSPRLRR